MFNKLPVNVKNLIPHDLIPDDVGGRLQAWWEGVEYRPPQTGGSSLSSSSQNSAGSQANAKDLEIELSEYMWGEGYLQPPMSRAHLDLVDFLALSEKHSVGFMGAGLGGAARHIVKHTGAWISGYEWRIGVIPRALEQCKMHGMSRKVTIEPFDSETLHLPSRKFNAVLSFEDFHNYIDRERAFQQVAVSLKPRGILLLTDFVVKDESRKFAHKPCMFSGQQKLRFGSRRQYIEMLQLYGMGIRNHSDITKHYIQQISTGWARWRKAVAALKTRYGDDKITPDLHRLLAEHSLVWAHRMEALQKERLSVYAFMAEKQK